MTRRVADSTPIPAIARRGSGARQRLIAAMVAMVGVAVGDVAHGGTAPSAQDIEAISHTLGFVEGMPHAGKLRIGIVCKPGDEATAGVKKVADAIGDAPGPGTTSLIPLVVAADAIKDGGDFDALVLMPGTDGFALDIVAEATRRRLVTVSTDPECLKRQACVLWIQAEPHVTVTLDTALAERLSVHVSPIFAMMVKRK